MTYGFVRFTPIRLSDSRTNPIPAFQQDRTVLDPKILFRQEAGGSVDMLHCFSPEDRNKKVTVYDVMHVVVRTAPFNVKRMRSRVDPIGPSSVYNEMNCVT